MKTTQPKSDRRSCDESKSGKLSIRIAMPEDQTWCEKTLKKHHYLGKADRIGDFMIQICLLDDEPVAILAWGPASYALRDRDQYIGWTPTQRAERQKLIVQNRRFALLFEKGSYPNLASRILGATTKALPEQWRTLFGYVPLLAETFTDIESFAGTCYKASGWTPLGTTQGYSRHLADFYIPNDRPKKLWVKPLRTTACATLCSPELPEIHQAGAHSSAHGVMPLKSQQMLSLHEYLATIPDPRAGNRIFHIGSILAIVVMALLSGYRDISQLHRFGQRLKQKQRKALGLPRKPGTQFYRVPGYKTYYHLLGKLEPDVLATRLSEWLRTHQGQLPSSLALDGKMIRQTIGLVCLVDHETGVPEAMGTMSQKEGEGDRCELKTAQRLIEEMPDLTGKRITADALHCQTKTAQAIVAKGGDFVLQIKNNQKTIHKVAKAGMSDLPPFLNNSKRPMAETPRESSPSSRSIPCKSDSRMCEQSFMSVARPLPKERPVHGKMPTI
jgi:hypothetical protein